MSITDLDFRTPRRPYFTVQVIVFRFLVRFLFLVRGQKTFIPTAGGWFTCNVPGTNQTESLTRLVQAIPWAPTRLKSQRLKHSSWVSHYRPGPQAWFLVFERGWLNLAQPVRTWEKRKNERWSIVVQAIKLRFAKMSTCIASFFLFFSPCTLPQKPIATVTEKSDRNLAI